VAIPSTVSPTRLTSAVECEGAHIMASESLAGPWAGSHFQSPLELHWCSAEPKQLHWAFGSPAYWRGQAPGQLLFWQCQAPVLISCHQ
jgi:hypothetical protein